MSSPDERSAHCVEHDAFDGAALARVAGPGSGLFRLGEQGRLRLPGFPALLADLFFAFYKGNVHLRPVKQVAPGALVARRLLAEVVGAARFDESRRHTLLDETAAAGAALRVGTEVLALLRREDLLLEDEVLAGHRLARAEAEADAVAEQQAALEQLREQAEAGELPPLDEEALDEIEEALEEEADATGEAVAEGAAEAKRAADGIPQGQLSRLRGAVDALPERMAEQEADVDALLDAVPGVPRVDAAERMALGEQLARSEKLRKLALLLGAMRQMARRTRRRPLPARGAEVFDVRLGADPGRLLASELSMLRHPALRRDVHRRFVEGRLLQYDVRGPDDRGRGPIVVCLDCSGSMSGPKELWSKAVALSLLETARRQKRPLRVVCFCAPPTPLFVRDLTAPRPGADGRHPADLGAVLELAEHFPGGGTDFRGPLEAALAALQESRYRRGDVVFVTDGEAQLGAAFLETFLAEKARLGFRVLGLLVDVGSVQETTLQRFADEVERVKSLSVETAAGVLLKV